MLLAHLFGRLCRSKAIQRLRQGWLVSSRQNLSNPKFGHFVTGSIKFASYIAPLVKDHIQVVVSSPIVHQDILKHNDADIWEYRLAN